MSIDKPRILIVDDQETVRFLAGEALAQAGFNVIEAEDGVQAVEICTASPPDLVLMDVMMPNMDGFEACRALRGMEVGGDLPIVMMTGSGGDDKSISTAYECGATDFIGKPFQNQVLCHRIRYILRASADAARLRQSQRRLSHAQRIAKLGYWQWELGSDCMEWSDEAIAVLGIEPSGGRITAEVVAAQAVAGDRPWLQRWFFEASAGGDLDSIGFRVTGPDGEVRRIQQQIEREVDADGNTLVLSGTVQDVTEQEEAQEKIRELAFYDSLTGLPNRTLFRETMGHALSLVRRHGRCAAVLFIDLDDFKRINDTLGHDIGDQLLQGVAKRLVDSLRDSDFVARGDELGDERDLVARLGGDEFTILLSEIACAEDAKLVAERIIESLSLPFRLSGHEMFISPSIGVCLLPDDAGDAESALKHADIAMYHAKREGKNLYRFFEQSMTDASVERLELDTQLRGALLKEELFLEYQPQLDAQSQRVCGVEALLRWNSPKLGMVSPDKFIPVAEENGLIVPIGEWVLRTACDQGRAWQKMGLCPPRIAVNVSIVQLMHRSFVEQVEAVLTDTGFDATKLELEITESTFSRNVELVIATLQRLKEFGLQIAIDDFGTGYSSLSQLNRFPVDRVKIDKSFVQDITTNSSDLAIATAVIGMANTLELGIIAEGVETAEQHRLLESEQCEEVQGYFFSRPGLPARIETLMRSQRDAEASETVATLPRRRAG